MTTIVNVRFGNGQITYNGEVDPTPTRTEKQGAVTIQNHGSPGKPAHFNTSFMLTVECEHEGIRFNNVFHWDDVVLGKKDGDSYRSIEDEAARKLAPALRAAADLIEKEIARFDQDPKKKPDHVD